MYAAHVCMCVHRSGVHPSNCKQAAAAVQPAQAAAIHTRHDAEPLSVLRRIIASWFIPAPQQPQLPLAEELQDQLQQLLVTFSPGCAAHWMLLRLVLDQQVRMCKHLVSRLARACRASCRCSSFCCRIWL